MSDASAVQVHPSREGGEGAFSVEGVLGFKTATALLERTKKLFNNGAPKLQIDLQGVTQADSAGLALLIEWQTWAQRDGRPAVFLNIPEQIKAIARISEVEDLIGADG